MTGKYNQHMVWVRLKTGYALQMSSLMNIINIMMIIHWNWGRSILRQTHLYIYIERERAGIL